MKYKIDKVNSWNGWDPLKQVMLGNCYSPEWFRDMKDASLRKKIQGLVADTIEDLDGIQRTLEDLGVEVVRIPENTLDSGNNLEDEGLDSWGKFNQYLSDNKLDFLRQGWTSGLPKPMITPRDHFIVLGNKFVQTSHHPTIKPMADRGIIDPELVSGFTGEAREKQWKDDGFPTLGPLKLSNEYINEISKHWLPTWEVRKVTDKLRKNSKKYWDDPHYMEYAYMTFGFWAPIITRVGDTLVVDQEDYSNLGKILLQRYPEFKQTTVAIGGHNDGTFSPVKPGHIVTANWHTDYSKTFPGWQVHVVENPETIDWDRFDEWAIKKHNRKLRRNWYQEGEISPKYVDFVDEWLSNWVGYVEESVFEVNMLSVSEDTILCLNDNKSVHDHLRSIGLTPIHCRFRHRHFWDGGLHCLTVDTVREGGKQNYFNN